MYAAITIKLTAHNIFVLVEGSKGLEPSSAYR